VHSPKDLRAHVNTICAHGMVECVLVGLLELHARSPCPASKAKTSFELNGARLNAVQTHVNTLCAHGMVECILVGLLELQCSLTVSGLPGQDEV
jgi:hypothetical protein